MSVARAIWSQTLAPGKTELARIDCDIKISLIVLDEKLANQERSSIKIIQHDPEDDESITFVLANLIPGKIEAQTVDLIISENEDIEIEVTGKNTVHLSGNYIFQRDDDEYPEYGSEGESSVDEEAFNLQDVSSDVEINPDELMEEDSDDDDTAAGRFEEVIEEEKKKVEAPAKATGKRPAEAAPAQDGAHKKHKKNKGGDNKPAAAAGAAKPEAKAAPAANAENGKPAGGEGKKHKKNKNKDKKKDAQ